MDDLVSRQKVLQCIKESRENIDWGQSEDGDAFLHYSAALYRTIASKECLPSAESEIIRCKDWEWWEKQKDSLQGRCALMQMYPTGGWFCGNAQERRSDDLQ